MGTDLRQEIIVFFKERMDRHRRVASLVDISDEDNFIVRVDRQGLPSLNVHLSDAYCYTEAEFLSRPASIQQGDFILVAKPEGSVTDEALQHAKAERIGIGQIGKLMGALNYPEVWNYEPPDPSSGRGRRAS